MGEVNSMYHGFAPGEHAYSDDQGNFETCTRHALGKAIVDGFMDATFEAVRLDFKQSEVTTILVSMDSDMMKGQWPVRFDGSSFEILEASGTTMKVVLKVTEIDMKRFVDEFTLFKYVLVHLLNTQNTLGPKHCLYVKSLTRFESETYAVCLNSIPGEERPAIRVQKRGNTFYQVQCSASPQGLTPQSSNAPTGVAEKDAIHDTDHVDTSCHDAISRAILAIFETRSSGNIEFSFDDVSKALDSKPPLNLSSEWSESYDIQDRTSRSRRVNVNISEVELDDFIEEMKEVGDGDARFIIAFPVIPADPKLHHVYVRQILKLDSEEFDYAACLSNVDGDEKIMVQLTRRGKHFYRVKCSLVEELSEE